MNSTSRAVVFVCVVTCLPSAGSAASLQTYVLDVVGQSGFPTYQTPQPVFDFFGGLGVSLPSNGQPIGGLAGVERLMNATSGILTDSASANGSGTSIFGPWSASGSSSANATYGRVGAEGSGTRVNIGDANTIVGFEGFGLFTDSLTITSPSLAPGALGFVIYSLTIDGTLSTSIASSAAFVAVNYQQTGSSNFSLMSASLQSNGPAFFPGSGPGHAGFTITPSLITGSGVFGTAPLGFLAGTPFELKLGLFASAMPRDGRRVVAGGKDGCLTLWDAATGAELRKQGDVSGGGHLSVAYSPDGRWIVSASEDCTARVYDAITFEIVRKFRGHLGPIHCLAVSDACLVTGGTDKTVKIWDLRRVRRDTVHTEPSFRAAAHP